MLGTVFERLPLAQRRERENVGELEVEISEPQPMSMVWPFSTCRSVCLRGICTNLPFSQRSRLVVGEPLVSVSLFHSHTQSEGTFLHL